MVVEEEHSLSSPAQSALIRVQAASPLGWGSGLEAPAGDHLEGQRDEPVLPEGSPAWDGGRFQSVELVHIGHRVRPRR